MRAGECCVGVWCCLGQLCRSAVLSRPALGREGEDRQLFYPVASALQYFGNISTINTSLFMPIEVYSSQKHHYISQYNSISTWPPDISHCALWDKHILNSPISTLYQIVEERGNWPAWSSSMSYTSHTRKNNNNDKIDISHWIIYISHMHWI